ncbi:uncharacterized protein LOC123311726 [Coccinella septempunctata]|uniref:uncharacterized protein LOC123311726 n=1 Tax=Coccinella septempunctata TaxID=41139 RepID=UPI001D089B9C|nr:uncharacterized protein LOC123311726 [Coccinella septempunctata]
MGNLPLPRISQVKPFLHSGVDYGGPFTIFMSRYRGAKKCKSYICLFVCMSTKAMHLELASDLSSDAFLACLRRFVSRRGRCAHLYSDQGTNFVGSSNEIKNMLRDTTSAETIEHHFLPGNAPHMGGLWESGIKAVKTHLKRVIGEQVLTYEEFYTVLTQIEAVLNSRPLTPLSSDVNDLSEYLHTLQQRSKWLTSSPPPAIGTLVLIKSDNAPPLQWEMGRIMKVHPGLDNVVRVATVKTRRGTLKRPLLKLCPLPIDDVKA